MIGPAAAGILSTWLWAILAWVAVLVVWSYTGVMLWAVALGCTGGAALFTAVVLLARYIALRIHR